MSEPTNQDLKDLILGLDKKVDVQFAELRGEIKQLEERLTGELKRVDERLNGIDKRLGNEEVISRSAFTAVIVGIVAGLVKYLFFPTSSS